ncbi:hypothetical protein C9J44_20855 [Photobacterium sp. GB-27]|uniref:hypothetical protein n=1 Tax=Photobacterium sp. GB-27 TaxID=2022109 RepID=UPI000D179F49|nr:hypothetical protein [Photobacterium sp. GB-27]PSV30340.1 hypothetical protein C9J44_20855 [Photobacterium sp. GB-27]
MLKITLDVHSGTQNIVVPDKVKGSYIEKFNLAFNPHNRPLFLQGMLLFLMGERVSLHAINQNAEEDDLWVMQKQRLCHFLDKLELKGCLRPQSSNYNLITYEQHRKHGVPMYAMQQFEGNAITPITDSRLNQRYAPFIENGLFDVFRLIPCVIKPTYNGSTLADIMTQPVNIDVLFKNGNWALHKNMLIDLLSTVLNEKDNFIKGNLTQQATDAMLTTLDHIFLPLSTKYIGLRSDGNSYNHIMEHIEGIQHAIALLKMKQLGYGHIESDRTPQQKKWIVSIEESISRTAAVFAYFMWQYLKMYKQLYVQEQDKGKNGAPSCTKFGLNCLDFKGAKGLEALLNWLNNPEKAFSDKPSQNSSTEYYKGVFNAPKYGVSTRSPVLTQRYDGVFELYIKSDAETEQFIMQKIKQSGRHYLRVGKLCLAELAQRPTRIPSSYWDQIEDDITTEVS